MRIVADENLAGLVVRSLREAGHDVLSIGEAFHGATDPDVLRVAVAERRVLITFDLDFANTSKYPPQRHAGIVILRFKEQHPPFVATQLFRLFREKGQADFEGTLVTLSKEGVRYYKPV
jgi:predicted nuclease of predicted toxin-antitoxin system